MGRDKTVDVAGQEVKLTNLDKVFWPKEGYTKSDLLKYYQAVSDIILPYLKDRPENLNRFPDGITGENFYHKNLEHHPSWAKIYERESEEGGKTVHYLLCQDKAALAYIVNLGCIELNPWNSRILAPEKPDYIIIDLDPEDIGFEKVVEAAHLVREVLELAGAEGYPKTSGKTGLHVYIPLGTKYSYEQARRFGQLLATLAHQKAPDFTSIERRPAKRQKRVYLDYLQNSLGQTLASAYSVRPVEGACVSMPLKWDELTEKIHPTQFHLKNALERVEKVGDLWQPVIGKGIDLNSCLKKLENFL